MGRNPWGRQQETLTSPSWGPLIAQAPRRRDAQISPTVKGPPVIGTRTS